ncbi:SIR2 family protein [Novipirellula maiorica]|nr:SIR2 family protein [Rhodopirellula maiorica]
MTSYTEYQERCSTAIRDVVSDRGCQPILFAGSGLSKRFFDAPSWDALLTHLCSVCPTIVNDYGYYRQKNQDLPSIGSEIADCYREWAWSKEGRKMFPSELFTSDQPNDIYLKHYVAKHFLTLTPPLSKIRKAAMKKELDSLRKIQPHAIISTNYDEFLERVFPDFTPVVGQQILRTNYVSVGEIFKIHGCAKDPRSIVLTAEDYEEWTRKKKYLSAKLLTYFAEHPLVFLGYSGTDDNIRAILSDIDEILAEPNGVVSNIFFVTFNPDADSANSLPDEKLIALHDGRSIRVRNIDANDYDWIFRALGAGAPIKKVDPKILRALLARNYELVRHDIPRKTVQIDFTTLEHAVNAEGQFANLLGISTLDNPSVFNAVYPYTLSGVARELGFSYWSHADKLIKQIRDEYHVDIKSFDNIYHITVKTGSSDTSLTQKYSQDCVDLLAAVRDGKRVQLDDTVLTGPDQSSDG